MLKKLIKKEIRNMINDGEDILYVMQHAVSFADEHLYTKWGDTHNIKAFDKMYGKVMKWIDNAGYDYAVELSNMHDNDWAETFREIRNDAKEHLIF